MQLVHVRSVGFEKMRLLMRRCSFVHKVTTEAIKCFTSTLLGRFVKMIRRITKQQLTGIMGTILQQRQLTLLWLVIINICYRRQLQWIEATRIQPHESQFPPLIEAQNLLRRRRRIAAKFANDIDPTIQKSEEENFDQACDETLGEYDKNGTLSQTNYALFLLNYCKSTSSYTGPACTQRDGDHIFNTLDFDFQVAFVSTNCPDTDPVQQLQCIQYLISNKHVFYYQGDVKDLCRTSFSLLQKNNMIDLSQVSLRAEGVQADSTTAKKRRPKKKHSKVETNVAGVETGKGNKGSSKETGNGVQIDSIVATISPSDISTDEYSTDTRKSKKTKNSNNTSSVLEDGIIKSDQSTPKKTKKGRVRNKKAKVNSASLDAWYLGTSSSPSYGPKGILADDGKKQKKQKNVQDRAGEGSFEEAASATPSGYDSMSSPVYPVQVSTLSPSTFAPSAHPQTNQPSSKPKQYYSSESPSLPMSLSPSPSGSSSPSPSSSFESNGDAVRPAARIDTSSPTPNTPSKVNTTDTTTSQSTSSGTQSGASSSEENKSKANGSSTPITYVALGSAGLIFIVLSQTSGRCRVSRRSDDSEFFDPALDGDASVSSGNSFKWRSSHLSEGHQLIHEPSFSNEKLNPLQRIFNRSNNGSHNLKMPSRSYNEPQQIPINYSPLPPLTPKQVSMSQQNIRISRRPAEKNHRGSLNLKLPPKIEVTVTETPVEFGKQSKKGRFRRFLSPKEEYATDELPQEIEIAVARGVAAAVSSETNSETTNISRHRSRQQRQLEGLLGLEKTPTASIAEASILHQQDRNVQTRVDYTLVRQDLNSQEPLSRELWRLSQNDPFRDNTSSWSIKLNMLDDITNIPELRCIKSPSWSVGDKPKRRLIITTLRRSQSYGNDPIRSHLMKTAVHEADQDDLRAKSNRQQLVPWTSNSNTSLVLYESEMATELVAHDQKQSRQIVEYCSRHMQQHDDPNGFEDVWEILNNFDLKTSHGESKDSKKAWRKNFGGEIFRFVADEPNYISIKCKTWGGSQGPHPQSRLRKNELRRSKSHITLDTSLKSQYRNTNSKVLSSNYYVPPRTDSMKHDELDAVSPDLRFRFEAFDQILTDALDDFAATEKSMSQVQETVLVVYTGNAPTQAEDRALVRRIDSASSDDSKDMCNSEHQLSERLASIKSVPSRTNSASPLFEHGAFQAVNSSSSRHHDVKHHQEENDEDSDRESLESDCDHRTSSGRSRMLPNLYGIYYNHNEIPAIQELNLAHLSRMDDSDSLSDITPTYGRTFDTYMDGDEGSDVVTIGTPGRPRSPIQRTQTLRVADSPTPDVATMQFRRAPSPLAMPLYSKFQFMRQNSVSSDEVFEVE